MRAVTGAVLSLVQEWLAWPVAGGPVLVVVTCGAVAAGAGEGAVDVAEAAVWGLVRSAQVENPGQVLLADVDGLQASWQALAGATGPGEPELAVRQGRVLGRRLLRAATPAGEAGVPWRLVPAGDGTMGGVRRVAAPDAARPLGPGEVRVGVRAVGLNFRDVLVTLGTAPPPPEIGNEGAGVVVETGPGVTSVTPGDRVMGIWGGGLGPLAVADERVIAKIPAGWSFTRAASVPVVFADGVLRAGGSGGAAGG